MSAHRNYGLSILVAGASGRLRPIVETLLTGGHRVKVTARDPNASRVRVLLDRGAEIVKADLDDPRSLALAMEDVEVVFAAGSPHQAAPQGETRHGINVAEAAAARGVVHLVFCSGAGAEVSSGVPVFESKRAVEQRIRELGIPHTILAPVYFMQNAFNPWNLDALSARTIPLPLPPDRPLQQLAVEDLAAVATAVIERGPIAHEQRIELAGDEISGEQAAAVLSRGTGRRFVFRQVPLEQLPRAMRPLFEWLDRVGHRVDRGLLRERFPEIRWHSFGDWATAREWTIETARAQA